VRILITGGCGFIGTNLVDYLLKLGVQFIRIVDNLSVGKKEYLETTLREYDNYEVCQKEDKIVYKFENSLNTIVELFEGDIRDERVTLHSTEGIDVVIHLAAQSGVFPSIEDPKYSLEANVIGTFNFLEGARKNKVKKFIFASSGAPLGNNLPPFHENMVPHPISPYGATKLAGEALCQAWYHSYGLETTIFRFSNVYGPRSYHKGSVVAAFMKKILKNEPLIVYGDGNQTRDFLYVEDLCYAIDLALKKTVSGEIFQLGSGVETSINELIVLLKEITKVNFKVNYVAPRPGEIIRNYADISKIRKKLGYSPKVDLKQGLQKTWQWFMREYGENKGS